MEGEVERRIGWYPVTIVGVAGNIEFMRASSGGGDEPEFEQRVVSLIHHVLTEAGADGTIYRAVTRIASETPWLHPIMLVYARFGVVVLAAVLAAAWWRAGPDRRAIGGLVTVSIAAGLAFVVSRVAAEAIALPPPCSTVAGAYVLERCMAGETHTMPDPRIAVVAAVAAVVMPMNRRLAVFAVIWSIGLAFSRVYVGTAYPISGLVSLAVGASVGAAVTIVGAAALRAAAHLARRRRPPSGARPGTVSRSPVSAGVQSIS
ncbi:hypothetical protein [Nocardia arizonensis]|uniref:hypothetical protein n=1 Tax=Nocardia arizonensis TaxID=1141647 RepID=UPI0002DCD310|nr:hypothetical protein [Nocardia arizonensis]